MHWKLFKSNIELLENKIGKNKYVEFLQPVYVIQTMDEEYDMFLHILHKYEKNTEIMALINKVDSMSAISSSTNLKLKSAFSSSTPTKRNHNDMIHDSRSDDENSTSNHNTNKKRRIWLSGEDLVIIKEATSDINDYATRVAKVLVGRSEQSISNRWNQVLKNQYKPNNTTSNDNNLVSNDDMKDTKKRTNDEILPMENDSDQQISKTPRYSWTPEEDNIVIHCYNENPNNYVDEAQKKLPHRTARAIRDRFTNYLTKRDDVNLDKRKKH
jgi:hypothetical protein